MTTEQIRFRSPVAPLTEAEVAAALAPLVDAGYVVTVVRPESIDGWRILVDGPTSHASLHVSSGGGNVAEWRHMASSYLARKNWTTPGRRPLTPILAAAAEVKGDAGPRAPGPLRHSWLYLLSLALHQITAATRFRRAK